MPMVVKRHYGQTRLPGLPTRELVDACSRDGKETGWGRAPASCVDGIWRLSKSPDAVLVETVREWNLPTPVKRRVVWMLRVVARRMGYVLTAPGWF